MSPAHALDTSVLVRLLVGQPEPLYREAQRFVQEQIAAGATVHVNDLVLAEAYFALQSFYRFPKADALETLRLFLQHSGVNSSSGTVDVLQTPSLATAKPGFVDRLIHASAQRDQLTLVTFEKAGHKLLQTKILVPPDPISSPFLNQQRQRMPPIESISLP